MTAKILVSGQRVDVLRHKLNNGKLGTAQVNLRYGENIVTELRFSRFMVVEYWGPSGLLATFQDIAFGLRESSI